MRTSTSWEGRKQTTRDHSQRSRSEEEKCPLELTNRLQQRVKLRKEDVFINLVEVPKGTDWPSTFRPSIRSHTNQNKEKQL